MVNRHKGTRCPEGLVAGKKRWILRWCHSEPCAPAFEVPFRILALDIRIDEVLPQFVNREREKQVVQDVGHVLRA